MEHTTPYPHQRQQILARLLLTIWLPTICSPEATFATTSSAKAMASPANTSTGAAGPSTPAMGSSAEITLTAQGDHQVTFLHHNGTWKAEVDEHLATGFSSKLSLVFAYKRISPVKSRLGDGRELLKKIIILFHSIVQDTKKIDYWL